MTGKDVEKIVRPDIADSKTPYIWVQDDLVRFVNAGVTNITNIRPDALLDSSNALITVAKIGKLANTISIGDKWLETLAYYVSARCLQMHAGQQEKAAKAVVFMNSYTTSLGT